MRAPGRTRVQPPTTQSRRTPRPVRRTLRLTALGNSPGGTSDGATLRIAAPTAIPISPPSAASTRLSVRICDTIRRRLAPSAERTASSRARLIVRARSKLATLAQHINSTKPTTARSNIEVSRISDPTRASRNGCSAGMWPVFVCRIERPALRWPIAVMSSLRRLERSRLP